MADQSGINLAQILLQQEVSSFFTISDALQTKDNIAICLDENDAHPEEYRDDKWFSKGFF